MLLLREQLNIFAQLFLDVVGEVQGSVSSIPNNYFDVFYVTLIKHKKILFEGKMLFKLHFEELY